MFHKLLTLVIKLQGRHCYP